MKSRHIFACGIFCTKNCESAPPSKRPSHFCEGLSSSSILFASHFSVCTYCNLIIGHRLHRTTTRTIGTGIPSYLGLWSGQGYSKPSYTAWKAGDTPCACPQFLFSVLRKMLISIISSRILATSTWAAKTLSWRSNHLIELGVSNMFHTLVTLYSTSDVRIHLRACDSVSKDFSNVNRNSLRWTIQSVLSFGCVSFILSPWRGHPGSNWGLSVGNALFYH